MERCVMLVAPVLLLVLLQQCLAETGVLFTDPARVLIARCRAACLEDEAISAENMEKCHSKPNCFMCWETCEMFLTNYHVWGHMCNVSTICFPGCQKACALHQNLSKVESHDSVSSIPWVFKREVSVKNLPFTYLTSIEWERPVPQKDVGHQPALVYIIAKRNKRNGAWKEILQTNNLHASVTSLFDLQNSPSNTALFAVCKDGVLALKPIVVGQEKTQKPLKETLFTVPRLLSLRPGGNRQAEAIIAWEHIPNADKYDVTWRSVGDSMDITGHLYTWANITSLSLWFNTVYSVQVSSLDQNGEVLHSSSPLLVFTGNDATPEVIELETESNATPNDFGSKATYLFVFSCVVLSILAMCGIVYLCKIVIERRDDSEDTQPDIVCDKAGSPLPVVQQSLSLVPHVTSQEVYGPPKLSLAKKLSRRLSNLELQYSPLSPLRKWPQKEEKLLEEDRRNTTNNVFHFPVQDEVVKE